MKGRGKFEIPKIGKGNNMSIAKAALLVFRDSKMNFVYSGDLNFFHDVIDIAGANHCGPATHRQVLACIRNSPFWEVSGTIPGWGNSRANTYKPSAYGIAILTKVRSGKP
jgi:hypothetical protein